MPAPNRRNHGLQGLADKVAKVRHTDNLADRRDRRVASRTRHEEKWQEAEARLSGPPLRGPALEREAEEILVGNERARHLHHYSKAVERGEVTPPPPPRREAAPTLGRYAVGCLDCWQVFRVHNLRPRVPICDDCKIRRQGKKLMRRRRSVSSSVAGVR
ncbi:MAG: hypothetical protein M1337_03725 [Actinobacteria bacterium]|nr:hypothetical protein [Actinomycetota bacterium]